MKEKDEFKLFLAYNEKREDISHFVQEKIQLIPRKQSIVDFNYGLFSIVKDIGLDDFTNPRMFIYRPWLRLSMFTGKLHLNNLKFNKKIIEPLYFDNPAQYKNKTVDFFNMGYSMDKPIEDIKGFVLDYFNVPNDLYLSVIANILKYTYNVFDIKNPLFNLVAYQDDVLYRFDNVIVGDILFVPLSTKYNLKVHAAAINWMKMGGSVFILEPLSQLKKDIDIKHQKVYETKFGCFRVVYYSMF